MQFASLPEGLDRSKVSCLVDAGGEISIGSNRSGLPIIYNKKAVLGADLIDPGGNPGPRWEFGMLMELSERGRETLGSFITGDGYCHRLAKVLCEDGRIREVVVKPPGISSKPCVLAIL